MGNKKAQAVQFSTLFSYLCADKKIEMEEIQTTFADLGLSEEMLKAVAEKGFELPTPIQRLTIPLLLEGTNDIVAQSQTGTGKTAAFGLPVLQSIEQSRKIQAIILVPTRELALQVTEELLSYNHQRRLAIGAIYGGASMSEQLRRLDRGLDVVVGTPGRLLDHIRRGTIDLSGVKYLVLDEADEMLDMGFIEDVEEIMSHVDGQRRVMLFSATMPTRIIDLSKKYMHQTQIVKVQSEQITADLTDQIYFEVRESDKFDALTRIIDIQPEFYGIVFCRTKIGVDEVANRLIERGYDAEALHGDISQAQREKILKNFKNKRINILVATDVAARGIDVSNLTHVINYSLPQDSESYVHRIGRTGRAGNQGTAVTFISNQEMRQFGFLKRDIKVDIKRQQLPSPQDIVAMKRTKIQDDLTEIIANDNYGDYHEFATEILEHYDPSTALSALLRLAFRDELDERNYPEIRSFSVDRRGTARLFIGIGRNDGFDARKFIALLKRECGLRDKNIDDLRMFDTFSFVSVPFTDAEQVIQSLNRIRKGVRPLAKFADDDKSRTDNATDTERKPRAPRQERTERSERPTRTSRSDSGRTRSNSADEGRSQGGRADRAQSGRQERYEAPKRRSERSNSAGNYGTESTESAPRTTARVPRKSEMNGTGGEEQYGTRGRSTSRKSESVERKTTKPATRKGADERNATVEHGKVRGYRDYEAQQEMDHNYSPDKSSNEGFDWSMFEKNGNSWGTKKEKKSKK